MSKQDFLQQLRNGLNGLPKEEIEDRVNFYSEMIDDRMEEGLSEEDVVAEIGPVDRIISQIVEDIPLTKYIKEKITPKRKLSTWEIVLLVLGSPIWLSLLIALASVVFSVYMALWAVVISLWAVFGSFIACGFSGVIVGIGYIIGGHGLTGIVMISAGLTCAGVSIFLFYGCKLATNGIVAILKKFILWIKRLFINKEEL